MQHPEAPWFGIEVREFADGGGMAKITGPYSSREEAFIAYGITTDDDKRAARQCMLRVGRNGYERKVSIKQLSLARQAGWLK